MAIKVRVVYQVQILSKILLIMNGFFLPGVVITNETMFYAWIKEYLAGAGKTFAADVKFKNTSLGERISVIRFVCL